MVSIRRPSTADQQQRRQRDAPKVSSRQQLAGAREGFWIIKGVAQVIKHENEGTLAALSLTPMHSLRHRLVRSRHHA